MPVITFVVISHVKGRRRERRIRYKTLGGARRGAHRIVGPNPRFDPDGYAVSRHSGICLFVLGAGMYELFDNAPALKPPLSSLLRHSR